MAEIAQPVKILEYPSEKAAEGELYYIFRHFPKERVSQIKDFARRRDATINDVFVTALLRTLAKLTGWREKLYYASSTRLTCGDICPKSKRKPCAG